MQLNLTGSFPLTASLLGVQGSPRGDAEAERQNQQWRQSESGTRIGFRSANTEDFPQPWGQSTLFPATPTARQAATYLNPPMSAEDHLTLSPWEKFMKYKRLPNKLVLQMALVVLVTIQTVFYATHVIPYFLETEQAFRSQFFTYQNKAGDWVEAAGSDGTGQWTVEVVTQEDFHSAVTHIATSVDEFISTSIDSYVARDYEQGDCGNDDTPCPVPVSHSVTPGVHARVEWQERPWRCASEEFAGAAGCNDAARPCKSRFVIPYARPDGAWPGFDSGFGHNFYNLTTEQERTFFDMMSSMTLTWAVQDTDVSCPPDATLNWLPPAPSPPIRRKSASTTIADGWVVQSVCRSASCTSCARKARPVRLTG
eukprot:SAG22_NODE_1747_length_3665_cov_2.556085_2_plen_368_part_00